MDSQHSEVVSKIAAQIRSFSNEKRPFRVYHGSTNSTRHVDFDPNEMIDTSSLRRILSIDNKTKTAVVEPNVSMDQLVSATLKQGLVPQVVMEFPGITVGGGLQGGAGESSSFKFGCFSRSLNWYEMILADSRVVTLSSTDHPDLYFGSAGSYGTLGVVTAAEVQLMESKTYVELDYVPVTSFDAAITTARELESKKYDYIDGIMFARDRGVIIAGRLTDSASGPVKRFSRARDEWFYLDADKLSKAGTKLTQTTPLVDYLFRFDRGAFWTGNYAFERFGVAFNRFTRFIFDPLFKTRRMYLALDASGYSQEYIVQDVALPEGKAASFMEWVDENLAIYPLWLCSLKRDLDSPLQVNYLKADRVMNVGVWGPGPRAVEEFVSVNRRLEAKVSELGGRKWLYAHSYYSEAEFWGIYDLAWYSAIRKKYQAESLPAIYVKTHVSPGSFIKASGRRGIWRAIVGPKRLT